MLDNLMQKSRTWFITGGATGLGRTVAEAALKREDRVVIAARDASRRVDNLTGTYPDTCLGVELDITDRAQVEGARDAALVRFDKGDLILGRRPLSRQI